MLYMSRYHVCPLVMLAVFPAMTQMFAQPAPRRSDELCTILKESAAASGNKFTVTKPGACRMNLDEAYTLFVDYTPEALHLGIIFDPVILKGDVSAYWLRLSTLD